MPLIDRKDVPPPACLTASLQASAPAVAQSGKRSADAPLRPSVSVMERSTSLRNLLLAGSLVLSACGWQTAATSQTLKDIKEAESPLTLKNRGSFFLGGHSAAQTPTQLGSVLNAPQLKGGNVTVNQMYVEYMVPVASTGLPVVMLHGGTVTGKSYDTTPDGRMGWYEYFVRRGYPVYVPDQVGRARSGADFSIYNDVRAGVKPPSALPNVFRFPDETYWTNFRFGPAFGSAFPDSQFPVAAAAELSKQAVPDLTGTLPSPNPNVKLMAELGAQLNGAVLMGHSQTGPLPLQAALTNATGLRGLILIEPGRCGTAQLTEQQISTLAAVPILVVFGDHLDATTGLPNFSWRAGYDDCKAMVARLQAAGGRSEMLYPPDLGIRGNSHMIMQDKNNLQIADLILKWLEATTKR